MSQRDQRKFDDLRASVKRLAGREIRFGVPDPAPAHRGSERGLTVANVLAFVEFGTRRVRERPIIRWLASARRPDLRESFLDVVGSALAGGDPEPDLQSLADKLTAMLRQRIVEVDAIDTGQTRDELGAVVVDREP